jgi:formylmethanofuran dehydrogenase subunit C
VRVRGNAGARAGDRLRRGLIIVEGDAGADPGSRMLAGTLMICGGASGLAGYLMRRGTLAIGHLPEPGETFQPCGLDPVFPRLLRGLIAPYSAAAAALLDAPLSRFMGDLASLGTGELLIARS